MLHRDAARTTRPLRILVSGMIATVPGHGGATWAVLQYLLGLRRLGHDVMFVEQLPEERLQRHVASLTESPNARYLRAVASRYRLDDRTALLIENTRMTDGVPYGRLRAFAERADVLINLSGLLTDPMLTGPVPRRVYLDLDPAFTQLWAAVQHVDMRFDGHTHFVTVGTAIGSEACDVPTCGRTWIPTLQPIVLEYWPLARRLRIDAFTTVANWRGYGSIEWRNVHYGQKAHSLRRLLTLPRRCDERFVLALDIHRDETADLHALTMHGWEITDPRAAASTPEAYRRFVRGSRAELGVAKSGYVNARCGWFSDRSICYLASGRPVLAQDTGFGAGLPVGEGLLAFRTDDDAAAAIESVRRDYSRHAAAARDIAETHFDSDRVLGRLLDRVGAAA